MALRAFGAAVLSVAATLSGVALAADPIQIDGDDIGGIVTSAKGPEAGVWVIAETKDLPTPYRKIVVTDDVGRYVLPDLPKARYEVWVRLRAGRLPESPGRTGQTAQSVCGRRPDPAGSGSVLPGRLLADAARYPREDGVPRHRPVWQRNHADDEDPVGLPGTADDERLLNLSCPRHPDHARDAEEPRHVQEHV